MADLDLADVFEALDRLQRTLDRVELRVRVMQQEMANRCLAKAGQAEPSESETVTTEEQLRAVSELMRKSKK